MLAIAHTGGKASVQCCLAVATLFRAMAVAAAISNLCLPEVAHTSEVFHTQMKFEFVHSAYDASSNQSGKGLSVQETGCPGLHF